MADMKSKIGTNRNLTKRLSGRPKGNRLHSLYNTPCSENFTSEDFRTELQLYEDAERSSGLDAFSSKSLPVDHPLVKILEAKRTRYLLEWESKMIPIGTSHKSDEQIISDFKALRHACICAKIDEDGHPNILQSSNNLFTGLNQYFPEMVETPTLCHTLIDGLLDKDRFLKIYIEKFLLNGLGWKSSNFFKAFNRCFRRGSWTQMVGNFQPLVMKYIILESFDYYLHQNGRLPADKFVIIDPCAGWGGRLLGVLCTLNDLRSIYKRRTGYELTLCYITTDPNQRVHDRFLNIITDWFDFIETKGARKYFEFYKDTCGSETDNFLIFCKSCLSDLNVNGANLAMTSPPYFNREKYSIDPAQSFIKYPTYPEWHNGFLRRMIKNTYELLLDGGQFYLNIADIKDNKTNTPISSDALTLALTLDFNHLMTYRMLMGPSLKEGHNTLRLNNKRFKYEPIFVLQK